jgi:hypothetical protein
MNGIRSKAGRRTTESRFVDNFVNKFFSVFWGECPIFVWLCLQNEKTRKPVWVLVSKLQKNLGIPDFFIFH